MTGMLTHRRLEHLVADAPHILAGGKIGGGNIEVEFPIGVTCRKVVIANNSLVLMHD